MTEIRRWSFNVQSSQRTSGIESDFIIVLPQLVSRVAKNSKLQIVCHEITVPFSFYQLSSDIATLSCLIRDTTGNTKSVNITLTPGNYNCQSVLTELASKLYTACDTSAGAFIRFQPVFEFIYSATTGLSTLTMKSPASAQITMSFALNTLLGKFFGFTTNQNLSTTVTPVSTQIAVANPVNCLFLRCSSLRQEYNREFIVEQGAFSDIVYKLPIGTQQNTYISSSTEGDPIYLLDDNIVQLNFYLTTNLSYRAVDLKGVDNFNFSFSFREVLLPTYEIIGKDTFISLVNTAPVNEGLSPEEEQALIDEKNRLLDEVNRLKNKIKK